MLVSRTPIKGEEPRVVVAERAAAVSGQARVSARAPAGMDGAPSDIDGEQGGCAGAEHALEVGSHRDGVRDPVGAACGERAGEVATAAVADQRDATPVCAPELVDRALDAVKRAVRAVGVGDKAGEAGPIAEPPQPRRDDSEGLIAGQKARHQDDRPAVAVRDAYPVPHRVGEQASQLEAPAGFGQRPAPPALADRIGAEDEPFAVRVRAAGALGGRHGRGRAVSWHVRSCPGPWRSPCACGFPASSVPASALRRAGCSQSR